MKTTMLRYLLFYLPCSYLADPSDVQPTKTRACDILIGIDDNLYELKEKNMSALVDLAQTHIDAVNKIYNKAVFVDEFSDVYFRLARVQVMFGSCDTSDTRTAPRTETSSLRYSTSTTSPTSA